ncbi:hypothetical protein ABEB36_011889 [Hypothenemus hampei]|uniref:Uncharacterized protein n=1 Tax=Hypothenemus hampei TaxID=57062 RepID=A0ABD1EC19_HYPHA
MFLQIPIITSLLLIFSECGCCRTIKENPSGTKVFLPIPSVNKFPPVVEFLVQRIQASQSNYVYEDLSRPPTYDRPQYTLSPNEQQILLGTTENYDGIASAATSLFNLNDFEYADIINSTEKLFEVVRNGDGTQTPNLTLNGSEKPNDNRLGVPNVKNRWRKEEKLN